MGDETVVGSRVVKLSLVANSFGAGGAERHTMTLAERLSAARFSCEFVPLKAHGDLSGEQRVPVWSPQASQGLDVGAVRRLAAHWEQAGTDVVLAANDYATVMSWLATRLMRHRPRVVSVFHSSPGHFSGGRKDQFRLGLYAWVLRRCAELVFVSDLQQSAWREVGFAPRVASRRIYNGIDLEQFSVMDDTAVRAELGWNAGDFVVGVCARLRPEKRVEDVVAAASLLVSQGVPGRLLVIGDGPERARLEATAAQLLPSGTAAFVGYRSDVVPLVSACDVMTLASDVEAFSISVLESMACGKAMVLTDVGGACEQVETGIHGFVVPTRSPVEIADRLARIWRTGEAAVMGQRARERVTKMFSLESMLDGYEQLLDQVLSAPRLATATT